MRESRLSSHAEQDVLMPGLCDSFKDQDVTLVVEMYTCSIAQRIKGVSLVDVCSKGFGYFVAPEHLLTKPIKM